MIKSLQQLTVNTLLMKGAPGANNSSRVKCLLSTVNVLKHFNIHQFWTSIYFVFKDILKHLSHVY